MNRLKQIRLENWFLQQYICDYLKILQPAYARYENEKFDMPVEKYILLANFYQTSVDYLLGLTDEKKPYPRLKNNTYK